jgi:hypothetical protein
MLGIALALTLIPVVAAAVSGVVPLCGGRGSAVDTRHLQVFGAGQDR